MIAMHIYASMTIYLCIVHIAQGCTLNNETTFDCWAAVRARTQSFYHAALHSEAHLNVVSLPYAICHDRMLALDLPEIYFPASRVWSLAEQARTRHVHLLGCRCMPVDCRVPRGSCQANLCKFSIDKYHSLLP